MAYSELIKKQRGFFNSGATRSFEFRRTQLTKLRDVLLTNDRLIFDAIFQDLRRPPNQTKMMEFDRIIMEIDYALEHLEEWMKPEEKQPEPFGTPFIYHDPLGVVLVISPFNFPAVLALRPLINAIGAGQHGRFEAVRSGREHRKSEFIAVVQGDAPATIALLEERFDHIFYTGSPGIARSIMTQAAKHLTPVTLELGGNPAVVFKDAPLEQAIQSITHGKFANVGQLCMATDYVLVEAAVKPQFLEQLKKAIGSKFGPKPKENPAYTRSGMGAYHGKFGFDTFTHQKAVVKAAHP
ncbi:Aldehyde dehydrogenase [Aphelenchoides fujianensis]|nr:Aldehyde dehydrogenase [Aphelenchoides fujianensis]